MRLAFAVGAGRASIFIAWTRLQPHGDQPGVREFIKSGASGITAGCGGGNFCPDNPLTRRQMAVFLAKALGLNWPDH
jgi:hypothetical protein